MGHARAAPDIPVAAKVKTGSPARGGRYPVRLLLHCSWISLLCLWAVLRIGRFGFSPTDQGVVLGLSWRIWQGEVPHRDLISARPLGSALLHTVDLLLPGPLFLVSSLLTMLQIVLTTIALAVIVSRRPLLTWGPAFTGMVAAACLLNLHTKSLTAWHTIDGLLLAACGFWALDAGLRSGKPFPRRAGLMLIGFAPLAKQSFVFAVLVAVAVLALHPSVRVVAASFRQRLWLPGRRTDLLYLAAPGLLYAGVVALTGGLGDMIAQLTGAKPVAGARLFQAWVSLPDTIALMAVGALLLVAARLVARRTNFPARPAEIALVVALGGLAVYRTVEDDLERAGDWGVELFWLTVFACVVSGLRRRQVPWPGLFVVLMAWMCSLSWGFDSPTLLGGTLLLTSLYRLTADLLPPMTCERVSRQALSAVLLGATGLVIVVLAGLLLTAAHDAGPYRDRPQAELTRDLGDLIPSMRGIRTNAETATYIEQIRDCVRRHPAGRVAVLPDNAFVYPALGLRNPFPMDWPRPLELVADARERMLATADRLAREGDYLLLFQTVNARSGLSDGEHVPASISREPIIDYQGLEEDILSRMSGDPFTCGSFVALWAPPR